MRCDRHGAAGRLGGFEPPAAVLVALTCLACGIGEPAPGEASDTGGEKSTVTVLAFGDETYPGYAGHLLVFSTLFEEDETGEIRGKLVRSWERGPGDDTWMLHLRPDVRWHDGAPFTARDVEFTIENQNAYGFSAGACQVEVVDDSTALVTNDGRCGVWPFDTWSQMLPEHLLADLDPAAWREWDFWKRPVGTGPYRWLRYVPKTMIEYEANPDYFLGKPSIDRVILKFGSSAAILELLSGEIDAVGTWGGLPLSDVPKLGETFETFWRWHPGIRSTIYWNHANELFSDVGVRRALGRAIDRTELARVEHYPAEVPILDVPLISTLYRRGGYPAPLPYDPEEAKRLLTRAGWTDENGDGVRERDGRPFRFTALFADVTRTQAVLVQDQLARVGVRLELRPIDRTLILRRLSTGSFDAAFMADNLGLRQGLWVTDEASQPWQWGYSNPRLTGLFAEWERIEHREPARADSLFLEITRIFREDQPVTYLLPVIWNSVAHRRIRGLSSPYRHDPVQWMEYLWIEEEPGR